MTGGTDVRCHEQGKASVSYQVLDIHDTGSGGVTEPKHYDEGESGLMEQSYNLHNATYPFRIQSHLLISPTPPLLEQSRTMSIHRPLATQYVYDDDAHSAKPNNSSGNVAADHPSPCLD